MTTYAVVHLNISNPEKFAEYRTVAAEALQKHGGSAVKAGPIASVMDTAADKPDVIAILQFPNNQAAEDWRNDPALADVHALRNAAGKSTIYLLADA